MTKATRLPALLQKKHVRRHVSIRSVLELLQCSNCSNRSFLFSPIQLLTVNFFSDVEDLPVSRPPVGNFICAVQFTSKNQKPRLRCADAYST
jgi:hypothetical protein